MCPVCMASGALMVSGVVSTGGLTALAAKMAGLRRKTKKSKTEKSAEKEK